jgi:hypothetical protein
MVYVDAHTMKFYFHNLFLSVPFLAHHKKSENASVEWLFLQERQSWKRHT